MIEKAIVDLEEWLDRLCTEIDALLESATPLAEGDRAAISEQQVLSLKYKRDTLCTKFEKLKRSQGRGRAMAQREFLAALDETTDALQFVAARTSLQANRRENPSKRPRAGASTSSAVREAERP